MPLSFHRLCAVNLTKASSNICFTRRVSDPQQGNRHRWALPFDQRCHCQKILPSPETIHLLGGIQNCPFPYPVSAKGRWWFIDDLMPLVQRQLWYTDDLAIWLGCTNTTTGTQQTHDESKIQFYRVKLT